MKLGVSDGLPGRKGRMSPGAFFAAAFCSGLMMLKDLVLRRPA